MWRHMINYDISEIKCWICFSEVPTSHKNNEVQLSSSASSGFYSNQSEHSDPSPPSSHLSESAPVGSGGMFFGPFLPDEGLDLEEEGKENESEHKVINP